jgi:hypothetical protein
MELTQLDMLLLFIVAIAIALVIGLGIVYTVDKKLNNIHINVPSCPKPVCPKPTCPKPVCPGVIQSTDINTVNNTLTQDIYKVSDYFDDSNTIKQKTKINVQKTKESTVPTVPTVPTIPAIHPSNTTKKTCTEPFGVISDFLNNNSITAESKEVSLESDDSDSKYLLLRKGYQNIPIDTDRVVTPDQIVSPDADNIVRYNDQGCYKNINTGRIKKIEPNELSSPSSRPYGGLLREGAVNKLNVKFMSPQSNDPNDIKSSNVDLYVPRLYMGKDPNILGISYASLSLETPADVDQIGSIPVDNYTGEPVAIDSMMQ